MRDGLEILDHGGATFGSKWEDDTGILARLNGVRLLVILAVAIGYASTMSRGPEASEWLKSFGYDPSQFGIQILFFLSGWLAWRSLERHGSVKTMLLSRARRTLPWVALYTLIVTAVLYPLLCDHDAPAVKGTADLALYFFKTVTLIQPGEPMPGALDNALYMCLLQGTIWTLRLGALAFIGLGLLWALNCRHPVVLTAIAIAITLAHALLTTKVATTSFPLSHQIGSILFVGHPFMIGVALRAWRHRLRDRTSLWLGMAVGWLGLACLHYIYLPWSPAIQILAMLGYCSVVFGLLIAPLRLMTGWPNLTLPSYLGIWPTTQTLLFIMPQISVAELVIASLGVTLLLTLLFRGLVDLVTVPVHGRVQTA